MTGEEREGMGAAAPIPPKGQDAASLTWSSGRGRLRRVCTTRRPRPYGVVAAMGTATPTSRLRVKRLAEHVAVPGAAPSGITTSGFVRVPPTATPFRTLGRQ